MSDSPQFKCRDIVRSMKSRSESGLTGGMIYEIAIQDEDKVSLVGLPYWFPAIWFELFHPASGPTIDRRKVVEAIKKYRKLHAGHETCGALYWMATEELGIAKEELTC